MSPKVANFSLPLGATMNMDGTALYEGVAVIFLIQIYGGLDDVPIVMTPMVTFLIFITAVLASVGAAAGTERRAGDDGHRGDGGEPADLLHSADLRG